MSVDLLRRGAAKIRENAEATVAIEVRTGAVIPWHTESGLERDWDKADAAHIASWSPDAALAAADLLDTLATAWHNHGAPPPGAIDACRIARTYLGEDA